MIEIENGHPICLPNRKEAVRMLLLYAAHNKTDIKYHQMYKIFSQEKEQDISFLTWRHSVWMTVEEVCGELATQEGAMYYSLLSNKNDTPEDVFLEIIYNFRKIKYEERFKVELQKFSDADEKQKKIIIAYERARVYRHTELYHAQRS